MYSKEAINFIETQWTYLSPFSAHQIELEGEVFSTVEHAYQAMRIKPGKERNEVINARSPMDAWRVGQKYKNKPTLTVEGFDKDVVTERLFRMKLTQHPDVARILRATKDRELLKVYDADYYWGTGADGTGENKMGKIWMKLRRELQRKR